MGVFDRFLNHARSAINASVKARLGNPVTTTKAAAPSGDAFGQRVLRTSGAINTSKIDTGNLIRATGNSPSQVKDAQILSEAGASKKFKGRVY